MHLIPKQYCYYVTRPYFLIRAVPEQQTSNWEWTESGYKSACDEEEFRNDTYQAIGR